MAAGEDAGDRALRGAGRDPPDDPVQDEPDESVRATITRIDVGFASSQSDDSASPRLPVVS